MDAEGAHLGEHLLGAFGLLHGRALGDLDAERAGRNVVLLDGGPHLVHQTGLAELER